MTQRRKSQSVGLLMIVVFSAVFLGTLTAMVWSVPVVYAGEPEIITITVTSNLETYFYDPGLDLTGGTVYFNNLAGEGAEQVITVTTIVTGSMPITLTGAPAFGMTPIPDTNSIGTLRVTYTIGISAGTENGVLFTVTALDGFTNTAAITFTQDNVAPGLPVSPQARPDGFDDTGEYDDDTLIYFTWAAADDNPDGSGIATYYAGLGAPTDDAGTDLQEIYTGTEGLNAYYVATVDHVGNISSAVGDTITIDTIDPVIMAITVTSDSPTYFYAPELEVTGGEVFFNSLPGEGGGQTITVTVSFTDDNPYSLAGDTAFGDSPGPDTSGPPWTVSYSIEENAPSQTNRVLTVTDQAGRMDTAVITFTQDNVDPTVEFTDVTDPDYDPDGDGLNTTGNWYRTGGLTSGWAFTSTVSDSGAGPGLAGAIWDHSTDNNDRFTDPGIDGDGVFTDVASDGDGSVTVTLTITDNVGNSASDTVVFNLDNTEPTIYPGSPPIVEGSPYLYANGLTVYYGDDMGADPVTFRIRGNAQDNGVGLHYVSYSAALNQLYAEDPTYLTQWRRDYTADEDNTTSGVITATIYDRVGNFATQTFTYTRDITSPDIYYGSPSVVEDSDYLYAEGTTVYYSNQMGGISQSFTVQGNAADNGGGAGLWRATFSSPDLNDPGDDLILPDWSGIYDVESSDSGTGPITVRVYDNVSNWSEKTFNYVEDTTAPTVKLTNVTDPGYDFAGDELDDDGSNWYNDGDFIAGIWEFTSDTADDGAGLASGTAFWDHSGHQTVRPLDCGTDGDGFFSDVTGDDDGTVTVTVTIADHVGNSASDAVVFNIDNTKPTVTLPSISESSDYLHADGLTIYYGDDMGSVQTFTVNGSSNDTGVGLDRATFSSAFGATPDDDTTPNTWSGRYYPDNQNWGNGTIYVTVYDLLDNAAFRTFHYIRDITPPVVDVTCPAVTSVPSFLVSWNNSADSPPDASGLNHLDVQYKVGSDGQWRDWLMDTSLAEATFGPTFPVIVEDNYTYYFLVRAEDNVSNEQQSNGEDATTYRSGVKKVFLPIVIAPDPNWGFETGNFTSWQHGGELAQSVSTDMPHSGNYSALLGSPSYPCNGVPIGSAWLRRSVTVPSSGSPTFSFYYRIFTQDKTAPEYLGVFDLGTVVPSGDRFAVEINGEQLFADANTTKKEICDPAHGILYPTPHDLDWQHGIVPLSNYKGQTIEITFHNYNWPDKWYNTYTYVDDVSVQW